ILSSSICFQLLTFDFQLPRRVPQARSVCLGLGFASSCLVIPTGATAPYAVAQWRNRGTIPPCHRHSCLTRNSKSRLSLSYATHSLLFDWLSTFDLRLSTSSPLVTRHFSSISSSSRTHPPAPNNTASTPPPQNSRDAPRRQPRPHYPPPSPAAPPSPRDTQNAVPFHAAAPSPRPSSGAPPQYPA